VTAVRLILLLSVATTVAITAWAGGGSDPVTRQRDAAAERLKAAKLTAAAAETDDLLVFAAVPEERAPGIAAVMQKTLDSARAALKVDPKDRLWTGKLTAHLLSEKGQFRAFLLQVAKRAPGNRETFVIDQRGDAPLVASGPASGDRPTDAQLAADGSAVVAAAVLGRVSGTAAPPNWLLGGFGRAAFLHAEGNGTKLTAHRTKAKALYGRSRGEPFKLSAVWEGKPGADPDTLATSLVDYLAYGPPAEKFPAFVRALRPSDDDPNPTPAVAFAAAGWKADEIEVAWRKWAAAGK
jgi:hypothetical protein